MPARNGSIKRSWSTATWSPRANPAICRPSATRWSRSSRKACASTRQRRFGRVWLQPERDVEAGQQGVAVLAVELLGAVGDRAVETEVLGPEEGHAGGE